MQFKTMKKMEMLLIFLLFNLTTINSFLNKNKNYYKSTLRKLWEEDMVLPTSRSYSNEDDSLDHCSKSNYKYFSYIITGAKVTFSHTVSKDAAVR